MFSQWLAMDQINMTWCFSIVGFAQERLWLLMLALTNGKITNRCNGSHLRVAHQDCFLFSTSAASFRRMGHTLPKK
jgi:hypothetical protein